MALNLGYQEQAMAQMILGGLFGNNNDPAYRLTTEKAERLKALLRTKGIALRSSWMGTWIGTAPPSQRGAM